jgi:hypothetical protein
LGSVLPGLDINLIDVENLDMTKPQILVVGAASAWTPPTSKQVGWKGLSAEQLRETAFADGDPQLS